MKGPFGLKMEQNLSYAVASAQRGINFTTRGANTGKKKLGFGRISPHGARSADNPDRPERGETQKPPNLCPDTLTHEPAPQLAVTEPKKVTIKYTLQAPEFTH